MTKLFNVESDIALDSVSGETGVDLRFVEDAAYEFVGGGQAVNNL